MNFFEHQDQARRNTRWLLVLLTLAVISLILITSFALIAFLFFGQTSAQIATAVHGDFVEFARWQLSQGLFWKVTAGVVLIVAFGTAYKLLQLRQGGQVVAENLGGRLLNTDTRNRHERQLLNIVEEMAIAAGTPVPPVYLLEEASINAFAAGFQPRDAVIGVTRGCMERLNREELQGVIAHEFSHILHGDMRLNIRLIGFLHGILLIGLLGYQILRGGNRSSSSRGSGGIVVAGLLLVILGYGGTFFGNIIKAAVSRQREFLADASAVQFTRNPIGISGALKKIGGFHRGSHIGASNANEFSHLYFGQGVSLSLNQLMATHPPLNERITRIDPDWSGNFSPADLPIAEPDATYLGFSEHKPSGQLPSALESIGSPLPEHTEKAHQHWVSIPKKLHDAAHEPFSARSIIYGLLLQKNEQVQALQRQALEALAHPIEFAHTQQFAADCLDLNDELRLPLIDIAIPALKQQSPTQYQVFKKVMVALIQADKTISLHEWSIYRLVVHCIEPQTQRGREKLSNLTKETALLLSLIAHIGENTRSEAAFDPQQNFNKGASLLPLEGLSLAPRSELSLKVIDAAIERLNRLKPLEKPALLKAFASCAEADAAITPKEIEVLRAIAESLDCPVPPLLAGQQWA